MILFLITFIHLSLSIYIYIYIENKLISILRKVLIFGKEQAQEAVLFVSVFLHALLEIYLILRRLQYLTCCAKFKGSSPKRI